jgi:hypothetical protein
VCDVSFARAPAELVTFFVRRFWPFIGVAPWTVDGFVAGFIHADMAHDTNVAAAPQFLEAHMPYAFAKLLGEMASTGTAKTVLVQPYTHTAQDFIPRFAHSSVAHFQFAETVFCHDQAA